MSNPEAQPQQVNPTSATPRELLLPDELALRLKVRKSWLYERCRNRADVRNADPFPFIKLGLYLRFEWADVCAWIDRQKSDYKCPNHAKQKS